MQAVEALQQFFKDKPDEPAYFAVLDVKANAKVTIVPACGLLFGWAPMWMVSVDEVVSAVSETAESVSSTSCEPLSEPAAAWVVVSAAVRGNRADVGMSPR